ncbi:aromatic amino acid ammonia-lyase [Lentzea sp. DG1S-22]|uniref:HAL/PAL/TAL family ammonia-lyase n=1 Tax=Lentzea sp. DG1S-22 TaxID=3108822 RepID=UPI002E796158|nr:aromatic amino acid ammonia-lyase [Lentzea sp. DG1S-22]WVH84811.1 aromatic amino acid ammonia-lyase [Lentzea sp. DG1S-22]
MTPAPHLNTLLSTDVLTPATLERAASPLTITMSDDTSQAVLAGWTFMTSCLEEKRPVYGSTTGFGPLVVHNGRDDPEDQCDNVLQHLTVGQGQDLPLDVVRATVLVRVWSLARGLSGVSPMTLAALRDMLATSFTPAVPAMGSVGASGDLVPLAHVVQSLRGIGCAYWDGVRMPAREALAQAGLEPLRVGGRDALSLVNGTSVTTAAAGLAVASMRRSHEVALALSALLTDLLGAAPAFLNPSLLRAFGHPETAQAGERLSFWLDGTAPSGTRALQEPYSVRCTPQLLGAAQSAVDWADQVVRRDLGGVSDNPLFFPEQGEVAHGGNFFGQPSAFASDVLSLAATQTGNLAERQIDLMVDPHRNAGLPAMLAARGGEQHAVQGLQVLATSLVAAMRRACTPASVQSIPTNLHNQDVVPFGTQAALTALEQTRSLRLLHGCLGVVLRQAAHLRPGGATAPPCAELVDVLAEAVAPIEPDRPLDEDIRAAAAALDSHVVERFPEVAR